MDKRRIIQKLRTVVAVVLITAIAGAIVYLKFIVTEEDRVKKVVSGLAKSLENRDIVKFTDFISPRYQDFWGFDAATLRAIVFEGMRQFDTIQVEIRELEVTVSDREASVVFYPACRIASISGGSFDIEREALHGNLLKLTLNKVDRQWRVIRAGPLSETE